MKESMLPGDSASWKGILNLETLRPEGTGPRVDVLLERPGLWTRLSQKRVHVAVVSLVALAATVAGFLLFPVIELPRQAAKQDAYIPFTLYKAHDMAVFPTPTTNIPSTPEDKRVATTHKVTKGGGLQAAAPFRAGENPKSMVERPQEVVVSHAAPPPPHVLVEYAASFKDKKPAIQVRKVTLQDVRQNSPIIEEELR